MKKVIVILAVMIAFVGAAFADAAGGSLIINANVNPVPPTFKIFGGKTEAGTSIDGTATAAADRTITFSETEKNLASDSIVVFVRLYQDNKAKYKGNANLTITATPLVNTDTTITGGNTSTGEPSASTPAKTTVPGITYATDPSAATSGGNTVVSYAPTYDGRAIGATDIGTFNLTWTGNDNLAVGTYQATITLTYTPE